MQTWTLPKLEFVHAMSLSGSLCLTTHFAKSNRKLCDLFLLYLPSLIPSYHKSLRVHVLLNKIHLLYSLMNKLSYLPSLRIVWDLREFNLQC